jgi:transcription antitermination factor NusG
MVYPQREAPTRIWLEEHGVEAFYPVTSSSAIYRGKRITRTRRYLPGYVFAKFPGEPIWWRIMSDPRRNVRDVIRMHDGTPGWLHAETLKQLEAMREVDEEAKERDRIARNIRRGDRVRIKTGPFTDFTDVEVVDVRGRQGIVHIMIFGRATEVEINLDGVEKIA